MANNIVPTKVTVGTTQTLVSAWSSNKEFSWIQADKANTGIIYIGGDTTVATATGFGELAAGEVTSIPGSAAVYCISGAAAQAVRVLTGLK